MKKRVPEEEEVLEAIKIVSSRLASKFKFGPHEEEDLRQEISIACLQALPKYDGKRRLDNYFWTVSRNAMVNFKRDKWERLGDKPCLKCPFYDKTRKKAQNECMAFEKKDLCDLFYNWSMRNERKKNLVNKTGEIEENQPSHLCYDEESTMDNQKIFDLIDKELPIGLRDDYIKYKFGLRLHPVKKQVIVEEIRNICKRHGIIDNEPEEDDE